MARAPALAVLPLALGAVLGVACDRAPGISPEPATSQLAPHPPGARPPIRVVVTTAGSTPLRMDPRLGLEAVLRDGPGAGRDAAPEGLVGLHLPPYPCECACGAASCPCASPPAPLVLAPGATEERTWDGALRAIRRGHDGTPCHDRIDPPPGRYVVAACDESQVRCGTIELDLPARDPIAIAIPEASPPARCDDAVRVRRAARIALGAARLEGAPASALAGCDPASAVCGDAPAARDRGEPPERCSIEVRAGGDRHEVRVTPAARDGAPVALEVWVSAAAVPPAGRVEIDETRWAVSRDGAIAIAGEPRRVSHTHGGAPARIGHATFRITNRLATAVPLAIERVEWLTLSGAREVPAGAIAPAVLPPRSTTEVEVSFEAQPAYATWNESFASRVTFRAGDRELAATVEHHVIRREPRRRDPLGP